MTFSLMSDEERIESVDIGSYFEEFVFGVSIDIDQRQPRRELGRILNGKDPTFVTRFAGAGVGRNPKEIRLLKRSQYRYQPCYGSAGRK
jgi:hypothetical protein